MSGETDEYIRRQILSEGVSQAPTAEPQLAQTDEWQRQVLIDKCHEWGKIEGEEKPVKFCIYPDIVVLISGIGHLEGTTHYTWEHAQAKVLDWEYTQYIPLKNKYKRDPRALTILYEIRSIKHRQIIGDSLGASRQKYVVQVVGGDRMIRLLTNQEKKKGGLFKW